MDPSLLNSAVGHGSLNQDCSHMGLDAENGVSGGSHIAPNVIL